MRAPKNLFTTIFLWFLGGMVLMAFVGVALTVFMMHKGIILTGKEDIIAGALTDHGTQSIEIYEKEGPDALRKVLDEVRRKRRLSIFIFDGQGSSLAPGPADDRILEFIETARQREETTLHLRNLYVVIQEGVVVGGKEYTLVALLPRRPIIPGLTRNKPALFIHLSGLFLTVVLVSWLLARRLARPMGELNKAARSMAEGNLSVRIDERLKRRSDEIGQLGKSFDVMARHVSELLSAQNRLIRDISHELRSPLARLRVALELARQRSTEKAESALDRIELEAERLSELIGQLLSLARLEADMGRVRRDLSDLGVFLKEIIEDAKFEAAHQDKTVCFDPATEECWIAFNRELLRSAVENVIRNAVRHTAEGKPVQVSLKEEKEVAVIAVRDYGPGVPEKELSNLFRPFFRIDDARDRETGGTGLGLAIAQRAVVLHGGKIEAVNREKGGLEVLITLPCSHNFEAG